MAFDQFDNAERVTKLGCGDWLPMRRVTADRLTARLQNLNQRAPNTFHVSSRWPADISISQASFASEVVAAIGRVLEPLGRQVNHCR
jgi:UDP:flavonoid glycosyltransferase YjiC (YdhE family)